MAQFVAAFAVQVNNDAEMCRIVFSDPLSGQILADIALSPRTLKELALVVRRVAKQYEVEKGTIVIPESSWVTMQVAKEDW